MPGQNERLPEPYSTSIIKSTYYFENQLMNIIWQDKFFKFADPYSPTLTRLTFHSDILQMFVVCPGHAEIYTGSILNINHRINISFGKLTDVHVYQDKPIQLLIRIRQQSQDWLFILITSKYARTSRENTRSHFDINHTIDISFRKLTDIHNVTGQAY